MEDDSVINCRFYLRFLLAFHLVLVIAVFYTRLSHAEGVPKSTSSPSPTTLPSLKARWQDEVKTIDSHDVRQWDKKLAIMRSLIRPAGQSQLDEIEGSIESAAKSARQQLDKVGAAELDFPDFESVAYVVLVAHYVEKGSWTELSRLLSRWCPDRCAFHDIEYYLALLMDRSGVKPFRAIRSLCDAWDQANDVKSKAMIARVIRRSMSGESIAFEEGPYLIAITRAWLRSNGSSRELADRYDENYLKRLAGEPTKPLLQSTNKK